MTDRVGATSSRRRFVDVLLALFVVHAVAVTVDGGLLRRSAAAGDDRAGRLLQLPSWRQRRTPGAIRDGPPVKPEHFRSVAELNQYLADLNEYYTVLGRPRSIPHHFSGIHAYDTV